MNHLKSFWAAAVTLVFLCGNMAVAWAGNADESEKGLQKATFAGGCFWCMEPPFEKLAGVTAVISGYTGGPEVNPTYREVAGGKTGHTEAVQITFDSRTIGYDELLEVFGGAWTRPMPTGNLRIEAVSIDPVSSTTMKLKKELPRRLSRG